MALTDLMHLSPNTIATLQRREVQLWINPQRAADGLPGKYWAEREVGLADAQSAAKRFERFRPILRRLFPELDTCEGFIESPLRHVGLLQAALGLPEEVGCLLVKADHGLPIAGSIKARGGIHEVLEFAEEIATMHGLVTADDLSGILAHECKEIFSQYQVAVGSTGNLGLSIGVIASALGMNATVHMSSDAKQWKKERLRKRGVSVMEHQGDYESAVAAGRSEAESDPKCHFVDDEGSLSLFTGYSAAAFGLQRQLVEKGIQVDAEHPLFVYIPCGVGGAPGGIAFGLAHLFGKHVHCFFAEPTASPCFLVSMLDSSGQNPSVYDIGLDNKTEADGLAVPRASKCAVSIMRTALSGVFTVEDETLFRHLHTAAVTESLQIEPSAAAAFDGPHWLTASTEGKAYLQKHNLEARLANAAHIIWTTGGLFVPEEEYRAFFERGESLME